MTDPKPLTAEARLRAFAEADPDDRVTMANYEGDDIAADILADLDAARGERDALREALLAELAESPLPGARYAYDVVARRFAALEADKPGEGR